jgi:tetratricopeptide (TPR) repeat protein
MAVRDYAQALALADQALVQSPADPAARFARANALIGLHEYAEAIAVLRSILEQDADNLAVHQNIGLCYYLQAQYESARPFLAQVYSAGIRTADLLRLLIPTLHHLGLVDEAVQIANDNPEPGKSNPALAGTYSLLYLDADDPAQAARFSARALAENPDSIDGLVVQATLRTGRLDCERARKQFERVIEIAPNNGRAMVGMGMLSLLNQDLVEGGRWLARGIEQMPEHAGSWVALGWVQLLQGDLAAAESSFRQVIELDGSFAEGHGGLASIMALKGDRPACEHLIQIAERLDPKGLSAKYARSVLMRGAGNAEQASLLLRQTLAGLAPGDGGPLSQLINKLTSS